MQTTSVGLGSFGLLVVVAVPAVLLALGGDADPRPTHDLERGRGLYDRHCSVCHGGEGRGNGDAAYLLHPAPRNLASGRFRLVSTTNGIPTQADLIETIRRGMPGSSMPPWGWLAEEDLWSLALYVRELSIEGQVADLLTWAEEQEENLSETEAREIVAEKVIPGDSIDTGPPAHDDPVTLARGRRLFLKTCAACHGADGTGNAPVNLAGELKNEDGTPNTARDFTVGIFKGGSGHKDIVNRILGGLPGSPMPATSYDDPDDIAALSAFVRSLIKPGAQERVVQSRRTVPVARTSGPLPTDPNDPAWSSTDGTWIALAPLWWRDQRVEGIIVRALHDGEGIAFRLSWRDMSNNGDLLGPQSFSDCAAIEISVERDPPLFAMGATDHPVDIAFWRAAWVADAVAARGMRDRYPGMVDDDFPELVGDLLEQSITARAVGNPQSVATRPQAAEALMAQGFGTVGPRPGGAPSSWTADSSWEGGYWDIVFTRSMTAEIEGEPVLSPGLSAFLAFAIWDGEARDRNGQKSVSVWHRLQVSP